MKYRIAALMLLGALGCAAVALSDQPASAQERKTATTPRADYIDAAIGKLWKRDGITPAAKSSDEEFLRRVYLDVVGVPPTLPEAEAFLADDRPDRRKALIDRLLDDPRFGRQIADRWTEILASRGANPLDGRHLFANWFAGKINADVGFNTIIRKILTVRGDLVNSPEVVPYFKDGQPIRARNMAGKVAKTLMGLRIQCAQCHDHPYEKWTQADFNGFTSFLAATANRVDNSIRPARVSVTDDDRGVKRILALEKRETLNPREQEQLEKYLRFVKPKTLDNTPAQTRDPKIWRGQLSRWIVKSKQTRVYVVNRFWSFLFGRGIVEPVDNFGIYAQSSHPELLEQLSRDFGATGWKVKALYRRLLNSRVYQLSSRGAPAAAKPWHFAHSTVRPQTPEQYMGSLLQLMSPKTRAAVVKANRTDALARYLKRIKEQQARKERGTLPESQRRLRFDVGAIANYERQFAQMDGDWFLRRWAAGRFEARGPAAAKGLRLTVDQMLALLNSEFVRSVSSHAEGTLLHDLLQALPRTEKRIRAVYLTVLSRAPTADEMAEMRVLLDAAEDTTAVWEDLLYALMMSTEFATNH